MSERTVNTKQAGTESSTPQDGSPQDGVAQDGGPQPGSYGEAIEELEDLLDELEGADVDVDLLAQRVARGVQLIRFCRARLEVVTGDVEEVVAELISVDAEPEADNGQRSQTKSDRETEAD